MRVEATRGHEMGITRLEKKSHSLFRYCTCSFVDYGTLEDSAKCNSLEVCLGVPPPYILHSHPHQVTSLVLYRILISKRLTTPSHTSSQPRETEHTRCFGPLA